MFWTPLAPLSRSLLARGRYDRRGIGFERYPGPTGLALALHEHVASARPGQDRGTLVIEDEVATVGADHQHGMTFAFVVPDHRHPHGALGPTPFGEQLALEELVVLAISPTVVWIIPAVDPTPMLQISD